MKTITYILFFYVLLLSISYVAQDKFIFFAQKLDPKYDFKLPYLATELLLKTADGTKINAILYQRPNNKKIIIYFHGNAGSLANWKEVSTELLDLGCNVLIMDYRGYGKSEGTFSEKGFYTDGETAYQYAKELGYTNEQIIFYGRSLGTGIAIEMALRHPVRGLILETPYTSLPQLAMRSYWYLLPNLLLRYQFNNLTKVSQLKMPVLLLHGTDDELIPVSHSKKLNAAITTNKTLVIIPHGQHNNLSSFPLHQKSIQDFLNLAS